MNVCVWCWNFWSQRQNLISTSYTHIYVLLLPLRNERCNWESCPQRASGGSPTTKSATYDEHHIPEVMLQHPASEWWLHLIVVTLSVLAIVQHLRRYERLLACGWVWNRHSARARASNELNSGWFGLTVHGSWWSRSCLVWRGTWLVCEDHRHQVRWGRPSICPRCPRNAKRRFYLIGNSRGPDEVNAGRQACWVQPVRRGAGCGWQEGLTKKAVQGSASSKLHMVGGKLVLIWIEDSERRDPARRAASPAARVAAVVLGLGI